VRELGAVDGIARAGHETAAADANPPAKGQLAVLFVPARLLAHIVERRPEFAAQHVKVVDGAGVGIHGVGHAEVDGVHVDPLGQRVEQALKGEPRLRYAVAAHGPAGRAVGIHPPAAVAVIGDVVQGRDHKAGVVGGDHAKARVGAAVEHA